MAETQLSIDELATAFGEAIRNRWTAARLLLDAADHHGVRMDHPADEPVKQAERTYNALRRRMDDDELRERYPDVADGFALMVKHRAELDELVQPMMAEAERHGMDSTVLTAAMNRPNETTIAEAERIAERLRKRFEDTEPIDRRPPLMRQRHGVPVHVSEAGREKAMRTRIAITRRNAMFDEAAKQLISDTIAEVDSPASDAIRSIIGALKAFAEADVGALPERLRNTSTRPSHTLAQATNQPVESFRVWLQHHGHTDDAKELVSRVRALIDKAREWEQQAREDAEWHLADPDRPKDQHPFEETTREGWNDLCDDADALRGWLSQHPATIRLRLRTPAGDERPTVELTEQIRADPEWRAWAWFKRTYPQLNGSTLRQATAPSRKSKQVRSRFVDGVKQYSHADAVEHGIVGDDLKK